MIINRFFYAPPAPVYTVSTLAPSLVAKAGSDAAASNYLSTVAAYNNGSFNGGGADDTAFNSAYTTYVTTLPGGGFGRDGVADTIGYLVFVPSCSIAVFDHYSVSYVDNGGSGNLHMHSDYSDNASLKILSNSNVIAPVNGIYSVVIDLSASPYCAIVPSSALNYSIDSSGYCLSFNQSLSSQSSSSFITATSDFVPFSILVSLKIIPSDTSVLATDYPTSSRVNTIINNYAIKNEDSTYNYITNKPIFDEDTLVFYNPLTGVSFNVTGWHYDYSTRRYTLTYTDNSVSKTATVEYGYNYITVTADGAASNYYYLA